MKILHIIDSLGLGGAQTVVKGIFEKQKDNKDIFLFALREREIKINIDHLNVFIYPSKTKYSFKPLKDLKKLIEKEKIDILHCHLFRSQVMGYLLKKRYFPKIKLIFHEHGEIFQNHLIYNYFVKIFQKGIDLFIAVSKATKQKLIEKAHINPKKIVVLYNFVDTDKFNRKNIRINIEQEKEKLGIKKDEFIIGFVGRLAKVKNCEYLIKTLPLLDFKYKCLIAGDGPERKKLEKLASDLGVKDKIIFLGYVDNPFWAYSLIDVLIVPSRSESFGIIILEAQACGCPVITSNVSSMPEVAGKGAILVNPYNINEIRKAMEKVLIDKKLRNKLIKEGYKNIKRFSWEKYAKELVGIYNGI